MLEVEQIDLTKENADIEEITQEIEAINDSIEVLEQRKVYYEIFKSIASGTTGIVTKPVQSNILLNRYEDAGDCLILKTDTSGRPIDEIARTISGEVITSTFDIDGNYTFSGEPSSYPVALVYQVEIYAKYSNNVPSSIIVDIVNRLRLEESEYDNASSNLNAINGQEAIDELQAEKEPNLPATPALPESKFLNGNRQWSEITIGSGGFASNLYFTETTSAVVGTYKQMSYTLPATETVKSIILNNNEILIESYIFDAAIGLTTLDAGSWFSTFYTYVSSEIGVTQLKIEVYKRTNGGVESLLFTKYSNEINNTSALFNRTESIQPNFVVNPTDNIVVKIYGKTTSNANATLYYNVGDGNASYINTPLALRHSQLRGKNDEADFQHVNATDRTKLNNTSGTNTGDETSISIVTKIGDGSKISSDYLPSYVDDVLEFNNEGSFPLIGEGGKIYVALDTNKTYRWAGTVYVKVSEADASSIGAITNGTASITGIADTDLLGITQSSLLKKITWNNFKAVIAVWLATLTATWSNKTLTSPVINTAITGTAITATGEASKVVKTDTLGDIYERGNRVAEDFKATYNKSSVFLNGTNAYISVANNADINFGTGTFSIITEQLFESGNTVRVKKYKQVGTTGYQIAHLADNKVRALVGDGTNTWSVTSTNAITDGNFHKIGFICGIDSASNKLVIDGIEDTTAVKSGIFPTLTKNNTAVLNVGSMLGTYHKNEVRNTQLYNYALTVENCRKYMYDSLSFSEIGGNNTDLTLGNGSFATDTTAWWECINGVIVWNSGTQDATITANGAGATQLSKTSLFTGRQGKKIRVVFKAKSPTLTTQIETISAGGIALTALSNPNLSANYQNYVFEGIVGTIHTDMFVRFGTFANGSQIIVDDIVVQQIGCVLDLTPDSIANLGWFDKSGNNLHATYTNALPINLQNYKPRIQGYSADMRGANVASATTITPSGELFHVTGTTEIATINIPFTGFNGSITIIPDGIFTWTTAGNIALAGTAVVSKALRMTYDAITSKWYPDYIA